MRLHRTLNPSLFILFLLFWPILAQADFQAGKDAYDREDYSTALKEWLPLAEQGNAEARYQLGVMYQFGRGLPKDLGKAAHWTRLAAEQGLEEAQNHLGSMYEDGIGVPKDYKEAERWYRLACPRCDIPDAEMMRWMKEGSTNSIDIDLDGDGKNEVVKEVRGPGVSDHSLTIEVFKDSQLIASINPNKFGIQANYKIVDLDSDGKKEIITWSGLWDFRLPGEEGVDEGSFTTTDNSSMQPSLRKNGYLAMVEDAIDDQWVAPPLLASPPLVIMKFRISRSGEISQIRIAESSGDTDYDSAAQLAVQAVNPLPPFPSDISESFFDVQYRFITDKEEEIYDGGHSAPHRYVFVTYKLIRGKYYPWNYYTTKKKYLPYFSWEGGEFPE